MRKLLLLGAFMGSLLTANAQNSCAEASAITAGNTYTYGAIDGTYANGCWTTQAAAPNGEWYMFAATQTGMLRINTNLPVNTTPNNDQDDTRISVFTGTCAALTCWISADDVSGTNFLTDLSVPVQAGTTYYIQFDDRWSTLSRQFEVSFTATECFPVTNLNFASDPGLNSVTFEWEAPLLGTPSGFEFEYGAPDFVLGTGENVTASSTDTEITFSGLTSGTDYEFYVRTNCGATDAAWEGPFAFTTEFAAAIPPYAYGFETANFGGWGVVTTAATGGAWQRFTGNATAPAQEGQFFAGIIGAGAASDAWLFSRPIEVSANSVVTITYYVRKVSLAGTGGVNPLQVTYGLDDTAAAQTNVLTTFTDVTNTDYVQQTHTFNVVNAGTYYIGFHYTAPAHTAANNGAIIMDTFAATSAPLSINDSLSSQFSVFPNPATNVINIANAENILVNGVEIVDINGRTVKSMKFDNVSEAQINISDLASGMYLMNISSDKGTTTKKIVKN